MSVLFLFGSWSFLTLPLPRPHSVSFLFFKYIGIHWVNLFYLGIFRATNGNISNRYEIDFTPAGWTFSTWGIIYTWNALWLVYNIFLVLKKTDVGRLYREPPVLTSVFHMFILSNFLFNIAWLFVFSVEKFWVAFVMLALITLTLYAALFISHRNIYDSEKYLSKSMKYVWLYRALVNNGLAFYATWVSIASMLNFAIALTYDSGGRFI